MATNNADNQSNPIEVTKGGTGLSSTTSYYILYSSANNTISQITTANNGVLATTTTGVPRIDTTNFSVLSTGVQIKGNNANTNPNLGYWGENNKAYQPNSSPVSLTSTVTKNVVSILIRPGIWDVSGLVGYVSGAAAPITRAQISISSTNSNIAGNFGDDSINFSPGTLTTAMQPVLCIPKLRIIVGSNTAYFLNANATFAAGTCGVYGRINALRVG